MRLFLLCFLWAGWTAWTGSMGLGVVLTLATLALCYTLLGLAVYWTGLLVYGWTHDEALREAVRWHLHGKDV